MVPGTEDEDPSRVIGSQAWDRLQATQSFPIKVKNTFLSEDALDDDEDDNAFARRQVSAPATCANALPQTSLDGLDGQLGAFSRLQDFRVDDFSPSLKPVEEEEKFRKKKNDGVDRANADTEVTQDSSMTAGGFQAPAMSPPPAWANTTTVMMRNIPNKYTQRMLLTEINQTGFLGAFDFLYLPIDPETNANRGYAFFNFIDSGFAWMFKMSYEGRKMNRFNSSKVVSVMAATLQGFEANHAHYSSARVNRGDPAARPLFLREPSSSQAMPQSQTSGAGGKGRPGKDRKPQQHRYPENSFGTLAMAQRSDIFMSQQALMMQSSIMPAPAIPPMAMTPPWNGEPNLIGFEGLAQERSNIAQYEAAEVYAEALAHPPSQRNPPAAATAGKQNLVPKFCPHCGGPIQPQFQFCPHCGNTISFKNI